ncbi:WhiB family transcriptional regulator [Terrabacter carboxydivorans]|uniref:4Fe-4S Wbl-type domain-containing protein n=1 Tax=Terrabacter carboxydivorans TaxID=619730 RepID=A0ABN3M820_9MICO
MSQNDAPNPQGFGKAQTWVDRTGGPDLADLAPRRWHDRGACNGRSPSLWLDDYAQPAFSFAVAICRTCPVQRTCLAAALVFDDAYGIYGGTTTRQRATLARRLRKGDTLGQVLDDALRYNTSRMRVTKRKRRTSRTRGAA